VAQLYSQALGSLFVASYELQDYGGGIRTRLHTGVLNMYFIAIIFKYQIPTSKRTHRIFVTDDNILMQFR
jgi:hypothetical protein